MDREQLTRYFARLGLALLYPDFARKLTSDPEWSAPLLTPGQEPDELTTEVIEAILRQAKKP